MKTRGMFEDLRGGAVLIRCESCIMPQGHERGCGGSNDAQDCGTREMATVRVSVSGLRLGEDPHLRRRQYCFRQGAQPNPKTEP